MNKGLRLFSGIVLLLGVASSSMAADRNVLFEMYTNAG